MVGHRLDFPQQLMAVCRIDLSSDCRLQRCFPDVAYIKIVQEISLLLVQVQQLAQPAHHQILPVSTFNGDSQGGCCCNRIHISEKVKECITGIDEELLEIFSVYLNAHICRMIEDSVDIVHGGSDGGWGLRVSGYGKNRSAGVLRAGKHARRRSLRPVFSILLPILHHSITPVFLLTPFALSITFSLMSMAGTFTLIFH